MQHSHHGDWGHQMRRAHRHPEGWTVSGLAQGDLLENGTRRICHRANAPALGIVRRSMRGLDDLSRRRFGLAVPVGKVTSQMNRLLQIAALKVGYTRFVEASSG